MRTCPECGSKFKAKRGTRRCHPCAFARWEAQLQIGAQVHRAIRVGTLVRKPCEVCGAAKTDAHHDDYSKPLAVRWLCRRHHQQHHGRLWRTGAAQPSIGQGA